MHRLFRTMATLTFGAALGSIAYGAAAQPSAATSPLEVETFTLDNGLEVVVVPDRRAPVVTHMVWYRVGAADEAVGESGIAHFLEHLMFKGTEAHPIGEFSAVVAELGGQENAFTSQDYTAYFQRVAKEHLGTMMRYEADRMTGLVLNEEVVAPERDVVLEERRLRTDSDPASQLYESVSATLFVNHPYGRPIIGWEHEIRELDRATAIAFYEKYYTPNNAILVVAGDVEPAEVRALAEETYGKIARRIDVDARKRPSEPEPVAARRVVMHDARVQQSTLSRTYLAPSYANAEGRTAHALDMLAVILGGGGTSRLHRALVADQKIAASAGSYFQGDALDTTRFVVYALPNPGVTMEALEAALDAEIARIAREGVTEAELKRARTRLIAETIYSRDSQVALARAFGSTLTTGGTVADVVDWPAEIEAVTADEVRAAAEQVFVLRRSVTSLLLPDAPGAPQ